MDDLDLNHHVNNINYLKWVLDDFDYDFRVTLRISSVEITASSFIPAQTLDGKKVTEASTDVLLIKSLLFILIRYERFSLNLW